MEKLKVSSDFNGVFEDPFNDGFYYAFMYTNLAAWFENRDDANVYNVGAYQFVDWTIKGNTWKLVLNYFN